MADKQEQKQKAKVCDVCKVVFSSAVMLCEHIGGTRHRKNFARVSPGSFLFINKLQYFIDTYMRQEPLVGLEYVEEIQSGYRYKYNCLLCGFHGERMPTFRHITGPDHISKYLDTHHPQMIVDRDLYLQKDKCVKVLQRATAKVCEMYGRKQITEICDDSGSAPKTAPTTSSASVTAPDSNGDVHDRLLPCPETKAGDRSGEVSGFKGNGDFLDYLQNFQIRNDDDARIIRQIVQNCTRALESFRQAQQNEPDTDCGDPSGKDAPALIPQTDATQVFFSSIKNMEESEVKNVLQKIAATNPAFRGIDVSNVVKYLKGTGRLKTS